MARAQGARAQMALAFETSYATVPQIDAEGGGFTKMPFASTMLGAEQPLLNSELLGYGRDPLPPSKDAVMANELLQREGFAAPVAMPELIETGGDLAVVGGFQ